MNNDIIISELTGEKLRKIRPDRLLKTGDTLANKHGQFLWEVVAFHPKGARVTQWPHGNLADWSWETVYSFYERVPANEETPA